MNPASDSHPVLAAADLEHGFGPRLLFSGLAFELRAGERLALTGPNGAGKSTLLKILAGLLRPRRGRMLICGDTAGRPVARAALGWLGHGAGLQPSLSGRENLEFLLRVTRPGALAQLPALTAAWDLQALLDPPARTFSEGQARRLALAAAFAGAPPLLLLDEPFTALDATHSESLQAALAAYPGAVVFATHDPAMRALATRTLALGADSPV